MAKDWINLYVDEEAPWVRGESLSRKWSESVDFDKAKVRIHETARSGNVLVYQELGNIRRGEVELSSFGDAEVYLKIDFAGKGFRYLSAPLGTLIELENVSRIELSILVGVRTNLDSRIRDMIYVAHINAHCVYEIL